MVEEKEDAAAISTAAGTPADADILQIVHLCNCAALCCSEMTDLTDRNPCSLRYQGPETKLHRVKHFLFPVEGWRTYGKSTLKLKLHI